MPPSIYKVALAAITGNSLLLCRPFAFDDLIMPGGVKEEGESSLATLEREIKEELGDLASIDMASLQYLGQFSDRAAGQSDRIVEIELYVGTLSGALTASSEICELVWYDPTLPPRHKLSAIVMHKIVPRLVELGFLTTCGNPEGNLDGDER